MVKLKMGGQIKWSEHRSGWAYALQLLEPYKDDAGVLFDGVVDLSFAKGIDKPVGSQSVPYKEDWIGFVHSAPKKCPFWRDYATFETISITAAFLDSLENCRGLFTLSEHSADYVREKLKNAVKVQSLKHPTEFPNKTFDFEKFLAEKKIVHVGTWLRRIMSFFDLKVPDFEKILLKNPATLGYLEDEIKYHRRSEFRINDVEFREHLPDVEYDNLLSESIVFIHLCDASATNTIVECVARNTPIAVNRIDPVVEYLGEDYPLYYTCIEEVQSKLRDVHTIYGAHEYLKTFEGKKELTGEYFIKSFLSTGIVKNLFPAAIS
jgi:hypothetical protein